MDKPYFYCRWRWLAACLEELKDTQALTIQRPSTVATLTAQRNRILREIEGDLWVDAHYDLYHFQQRLMGLADEYLAETGG